MGPLCDPCVLHCLFDIVVLREDGICVFVFVLLWCLLTVKQWVIGWKFGGGGGLSSFRRTRIFHESIYTLLIGSMMASLCFVWLSSI